MEKRPVDHVCGLNEIEQTADNLAEELVGKGDDDVSA